MTWSTAAAWCLTLLCVFVCGAIAVEVAFIPVSLDPIEMVTAGADPWMDALTTTAAFAGLCVVAALALALWHSARFRAVGLGLIVAVVGSTIWACVWAAREYF